MLKVIGVGKIKDKHMKALCDEYIKRIQPFHKLEVIEVSDEMIPNNASQKDELAVLEREGNKVLSKIKEGEYVILLDLHGKEIDSIALANKIKEIQLYKTSNITFVIGGSLGLSTQLIERSDYRLKLSNLTFLHQMVRLITLEQIYRSFKILGNETYHK